MPNVIIFGDSRHPSLRHEVAVPLPDPIGYLETRGLEDDPRRLARRSSHAGARGLRGRLVRGARSERAARRGNGARCRSPRLRRPGLRRLGIGEAVVPGDFPLELADQLRAGGVRLTADGAMFDLRRRVKTPSELEGIRRAQRAAEAAMHHVRDGLARGGEPTAEQLRAARTGSSSRTAACRTTCWRSPPAAHGADPHDQGAGPIPRASRSSSTSSRVTWPRGAGATSRGRSASASHRPSSSPGTVSCARRSFGRRTPSAPGSARASRIAIACDVIREAGYATRLDRGRGRAAPRTASSTTSGHGLGLDLHEAPTLDEGGEILVAGDVVTIEPGIYRPWLRRLPIEDVVLVTDDGYELLTDFPYDLAP